MENQKKDIEGQKNNNPEQFPVGRNHNPEAEQENNEDSKYTAQENEFADGKGTKLAEAFDDENDEQGPEKHKNQQSK